MQASRGHPAGHTSHAKVFHVTLRRKPKGRSLWVLTSTMRSSKTSIIHFEGKLIGQNNITERESERHGLRRNIARLSSAGWTAEYVQRMGRVLIDQGSEWYFMTGLHSPRAFAHWFLYIVIWAAWVALSCRFPEPNWENMQRNFGQGGPPLACLSLNANASSSSNSSCDWFGVYELNRLWWPASRLFIPQALCLTGNWGCRIEWQNS